MIAVSEMLILGLVLVIIGLIFTIVFIIVDFKKNAPEAFIISKARRKKLPITLVHYPEGTVRPYIPKVDNTNPEVSSPTFIVGNAGIKFRNPDGKKIERWNGDIPLLNYFVNTPESVATFDAVAHDQLKDWLKKEGYDIENIEDIAFYVLSEFERTGDINRALKNAKIDNEEKKKTMIDFLTFVESRKKDIKDLKLESGVFTYKTAVRALDSVIAYTSSNVAHAKSVWEASLRRKLANENRDLVAMAIVFLIICIGLATFYMIVRG